VAVTGTATVVGGAVVGTGLGGGVKAGTWPQSKSHSSARYTPSILGVRSSRMGVASGCAEANASASVARALDAPLKPAKTGTAARKTKLEPMRTREDINSRDDQEPANDSPSLDCGKVTSQLSPEPSLEPPDAT
jgi:hypothetical protein